jgi:hypothetical protein
MGRRRKGDGKKKVHYTVIYRKTETGETAPEYELLDRLVAEHHPDLAEAEFVLVWRDSWKPDKDLRQTLGKCKRASDFDREMREYDFAIILNRMAWGHLSAAQREALMDHELTHAAPAIDDETGDQKEDERGRKLWRIRKHDIEEFTSIVRRHGLYKDDLAEFVKAAARKAGRGLFEGGEAESDKEEEGGEEAA